MDIRNKIEVLKGDITKITVDVIVNAANTSLLGGGGVDGAIHRAGGQIILEDCRKIIAKQGGCKTGEAVITRAGNLNAKFVIHTVGPVWNGGNKNEKQELTDCYAKSMQLAIDNNCTSVAFPCISTGIYRFPTNEAAKIAVSTVVKLLLVNDKIEKIIFVCYDDDNFHFVKGNLNYLVYTIPSKLIADNKILGTVNLGLADSGMGVLSGRFIPNDNYEKHRDFFRKKLIEDSKINLMDISHYTQENNFKVFAEDGTEFKDPIGGLIIYDYEDDPIEIELAGVANDIWGQYFK